MFSLTLNAKNEPLSNRSGFVLILSSYDYENAWSTGISRRIRHEIELHDPTMIVNTAYARITNRTSFITGRFGMQAAFVNGRVSKEMYRPDVLVLIGDESWMYYRIMNLRGTWNNIPVLLVGARSRTMTDYASFRSGQLLADSALIPLEQSKNGLPVTAVMRKESEAYTLWLMRQLMPDLENVLFLTDGGYQDAYALNEIKSVLDIQFPELKLHIIPGTMRKEKIAEELSRFSDNSAMLLGLGEVPENVNFPVFRLNDYRLTGTNVVGGYYPSQDDYAKAAGSAIMRIYGGESPDSIPFTYVSGERPYLNKTALEHFNLEVPASEMPDAEYVNIPLPFFKRHMRAILLLSLTAIILIIIFLLNLREKRYRKFLLQSVEKYKRIYDEYQIVYQNMPMGLAFFDLEGNLLHRNQASDLFFSHLNAEETANFNLYRSGLIDEQSKIKIGRKLLVNKTVDYDDRSLRLIFRHVSDENNEENILMIALDYTDIQQEKAAKERVHGIFNFAMNASSLGVSEYNLVDKKRFATDAWYKNLCIDNNPDAADVYRSVVPEDREKLERFIHDLGDLGEVYFTDIIRVRDGDEIHRLRYVIQLLEYGPEEGRIIVAELALNIDSQIQRKEALEQALREAEESDRLKNAFVANMSNDIRPDLDKLFLLSNRLTETDDEAEKQELMSRIEQHNNTLLAYIDRIIELSKTSVAK